MYLNLSLTKDKNNFELGEVLGYSTMIIALSTIFFAIKAFRDKHQHGMITFGKSFLIGLYITLIAGAIYAIGWEIYYQNFASDFMTQYTTHYIEKMKSSGASELEIKQQIESMADMQELYKNPILRFGFTLMEILPVGIIISLISAAFLFKRKQLTT